MTKKELNELTEQEYCAKLDKAINKVVDNFYNGEKDMPCIMLVPHKYGLALVRRMPQDLRDKVDNDEEIEASDVAFPLTNGIAAILDLVKADEALRGRKRLEQSFNDEVGYQVLTILLGEILAAGRMDDNLGLSKCRGMQEVIAAVEEMHGIEDDDDDDDEDCECDDCDCDECCKGVCIKGKDGATHHVRGMEMKLSDLSPKQIMKLIALMMNDDISDEEKGKRLEKMLLEFGAKPVSKEKLEEFVKKNEKKED